MQSKKKKKKKGKIVNRDKKKGQRWAPTPQKQPSPQQNKAERKKETQVKVLINLKNPFKNGKKILKDFLTNPWNRELAEGKSVF